MRDLVQLYTGYDCRSLMRCDENMLRMCGSEIRNGRGSTLRCLLLGAVRRRPGWARSRRDVWHRGWNLRILWVSSLGIVFDQLEVAMAMTVMMMVGRMKF